MRLRDDRLERLLRSLHFTLLRLIDRTVRVARKRILVRDERIVEIIVVLLLLVIVVDQQIVESAVVVVVAFESGSALLVDDLFEFSFHRLEFAPRGVRDVIDRHRGLRARARARAARAFGVIPRRARGIRLDGHPTQFVVVREPVVEVHGDDDARDVVSFAPSARALGRVVARDDECGTRGPRSRGRGGCLVPRARAEAARDGALATARDRAKRKGKFVTTLKWLYGARARTRARTRARHRAASVHARRSNTSSTS